MAQMSLAHWANFASSAPLSANAARGENHTHKKPKGHRSDNICCPYKRYHTPHFLLACSLSAGARVARSCSTKEWASTLGAGRNLCKC